MSCTKTERLELFYMVQDTSTLHTFEIMTFSMRGNHEFTTQILEQCLKTSRPHKAL